MCAAIFAQIEAGKSQGTQLGSATKVALAVFVILAVAALVGVKVLHLFGVSLDAFMVAGGVLAWLGFSMLRGLPPGPPAAAKPEDNPSLTPLILFAAIALANESSFPPLDQVRFALTFPGILSCLKIN
jgi:multiple antibiotic resistance protein